MSLVSRTTDNPAILIVEDDHDLGDLVTLILQTQGFTTRLIRDGGTAMRELNTDDPNVPQIILLDMHLPGVSGVEIMSYVKHDARYNETKLIVTTADLQLADRAQRVADHVCTKPYSIDELLMAVTGFASILPHVTSTIQ